LFFSPMHHFSWLAWLFLPELLYFLLFSLSSFFFISFSFLFLYFFATWFWLSSAFLLFLMLLMHQAQEAQPGWSQVI
jgi:hypothetical protein